MRIPARVSAGPTPTGFIYSSQVLNQTNDSVAQAGSGNAYKSLHEADSLSGKRRVTDSILRWPRIWFRIIFMQFFVPTGYSLGYSLDGQGDINKTLRRLRLVSPLLQSVRVCNQLVVTVHKK